MLPCSPKCSRASSSTAWAAGPSQMLMLIAGVISAGKNVMLVIRPSCGGSAAPKSQSYSSAGDGQDSTCPQRFNRGDPLEVVAAAFDQIIPVSSFIVPLPKQLLFD